MIMGKETQKSSAPVLVTLVSKKEKKYSSLLCLQNFDTEDVTRYTTSHQKREWLDENRTSNYARTPPWYYQSAAGGIGLVVDCDAGFRRMTSGTNCERAWLPALWRKYPTISQAPIPVLVHECSLERDVDIIYRLSIRLRRPFSGLETRVRGGSRAKSGILEAHRTLSRGLGNHQTATARVLPRWKRMLDVYCVAPKFKVLWCFFPCTFPIATIEHRM